MAVAGVGLVVGSAGAQSLWGDAFLIAGGLAWAAYNILARRDGSGTSPIVVTYYQTLAGAAGFVLLSLSEVDRWRVPSGPDALRIVAVNLLNIVPVAGLGWAVLLAGERPTLVHPSAARWSSPA
ncbi:MULTISPECIES: hypothetical protein [unclassified Amycolatopsis]|uniref:hypothetical protein n=1 Tax=unclassified Amycolatopsis TaxID=2618356 RepID=UPI002876ACA6|nr:MULTISPECIES: hypothetical protein [unclassified Amycolatopsis]MDS0138680.1 hypothetical protein [Amycolatopsis sp. 505]MDS0146043.1 hypothetical protein [Amycolatopsis sp. CM201R]